MSAEQAPRRPLQQQRRVRSPASRLIDGAAFGVEEEDLSGRGRRRRSLGGGLCLLSLLLRSLRDGVDRRAQPPESLACVRRAPQGLRRRALRGGARFSTCWRAQAQGVSPRGSSSARCRFLVPPFSGTMMSIWPPGGAFVSTRTEEACEPAGEETTRQCVSNAHVVASVQQRIERMIPPASTWAGGRRWRRRLGRHSDVLHSRGRSKKSKGTERCTTRVAGDCTEPAQHAHQQRITDAVAGVLKMS